MAKLSWAETYSVAKSQGLSDTQAAASANNWAQKGGKDASTVPQGASTTAHAAPTSWSTSDAQAVASQTNNNTSDAYKAAPLTIKNEDGTTFSTTGNYLYDNTTATRPINTTPVKTAAQLEAEKQALLEAKAKEEEAAKQAAIQKKLEEQRAAYINQQKAALQQQRDEQKAALQRAYQTAIAEGQISVKDAEAAFKSKKDEIDKNAYTQSDTTALYGQQYGIANSQQMIGLQQGDSARVNNMVNANMSERDNRIAAIQDRLKALSAQTDIESTLVDSTYNNSLNNAVSTAEMNYQDKSFNLDLVGLENYYNIQSDERKNQYVIDADERAKIAKLEENAQLAGLSIKEILLKHGLDLEIIGIENQYKLAQIDKQAQIAAANKANGSNDEKRENFIALYGWDYYNPKNDVEIKTAAQKPIETWIYNGVRSNKVNDAIEEMKLKGEYNLNNTLGINLERNLMNYKPE